MAGLDMTMKVKSAEYRPCVVGGRKALFHRWVESDKIFFNIEGFCSKETLERVTRHYKDHDILFDGTTRIDKAKIFYGLVEYEDGTMEKVDPEKIKFKDSARKFKEES